MTKFQKQMLTIAAAGALTAVTALPALAFENEFHGLYNFNTVFSNYNNGKGGNNFDPTLMRDKNKTNNYMEQRVRLQYTAKASDDLKLVTQFEINNQYGLKKDAGTAGTEIDTDTYNVQVKHAYLDFNIGKNFNTKLGMQPYKDTLKGIFIDADVAAVMTKTKLGAYTMDLGFTRLSDSQFGLTRTGDLNKDLFIMDNTFAFSKDTKAALSYYFLADYTIANQRDMTHTLGLSAETKLGPVALSGFAAMQAGHTRGAANARTTKHGWAANVAAKANVGPGTARTGFLFVSGDNGSTGHDKGWANTGVQSYNESGLIILTRNTANSPSNTDQYLRRVITNQAVAYLGYDAKLTDKFSLDGGVGFAWVPASDKTGVKNNAFTPAVNVAVPKDAKTGNPNASDFMGTEIGLTAGYQLYKNLKLMAQGAYMINGGYYKNSASNAQKDPENPYTMRLQARYSF